jgi:hypothetical protein
MSTHSRFDTLPSLLLLCAMGVPGLAGCSSAASGEDMLPGEAVIEPAVDEPEPEPSCEENVGVSTEALSANPGAHILWQRSSGQMTTWLMTNGTVGAQVNTRIVGPEWKVKGTGDFDGNGEADYLWRHDNGTVAIWYMAGNVVTAEGYPGAPGNEWQVQGVGDFDGDAKADVLWRDNLGNLAIWLEGKLTRATYPTYKNAGTRTGLEWRVEGVGDINGNGKTDIIWRNNEGILCFWFMSGGKWLGDTCPGTKSIGWVLNAVGDMDGNGKADILWRNSIGNLSVSLNGQLDSGSPSFENRGGIYGLGWVVQGLGDFDRDGKEDILWRDATQGTLQIWYMNGVAFRSNRLVSTASDVATWNFRGILKNR